MQCVHKNRCLIRIVNPVTLIVAVCTADDSIIIGADSLVYLADEINNLNPSFAENKLWNIRQANWTLACAGSDIVGAFYKRIEAEVELGQRPPFDSHLEIGGPAYLNALTALAFETQNVAPDRNMLPTTVLLAGFDLKNKPYLLQTQLPMGGYFAPPGGVAILGAQDAVVWWMLSTLGACCDTSEAAEKLICFTIWQASKRDMRLGRPEADFPISLCVMEAGKPNRHKRFDRSAVDTWMKDWEAQLRNCLLRTINAIGTAG
jgi:hypothetical protein